MSISESEEGLKLEFFNAADLSGRSTNILTRIKMAKAFQSLDCIQSLEVFCAYSGQEAKRAIDRRFEGIDAELRKFYLPRYKNENYSRGILYIFYKFFLNQVLNLIYFVYLAKGSNNSIKYFWGWSYDSLIAVLLYSYVLEGDFILELDDSKITETKIGVLIYLKAAMRSERVITVSNRTKKELVEKGVSRDKIKVLPNAIDSVEYQNISDKQEARANLGLDPDSFIVGYTGHLYQHKGIERLIETAQRTEFDDLKIIVVGGLQQDIEKYRKKVVSEGLNDTVEVIGYVDRAKVPLYQKASDVLVVPNNLSINNSEYYTSPVKLREYIMSGNPVVASALPDIKSQFSREEIFYFEPGNTQDLIEKIRCVRGDHEEAERRSKKALQSVKDYTWTKRALEVLKR